MGRGRGEVGRGRASVPRSVPANRGGQFARQWRLVTILTARRYGATIDELSAELEVVRRTVQRDIQVLLSAGLPLEREDRTGEPSRWVCRFRITPGQVLLSELDLVAIFAAGRALAAFAGSSLASQVEDALHKIEKALPVACHDYLGSLSGILAFAQREAPDVDEEVFDLFVDSIRERNRVEVTYGGAVARRSTFVVHPYLLTGHAGRLYAVVVAERGLVPIFLRLDRVADARLLDGVYGPLDGFDPHAFLAESFGMWHEGEVEEISVEFDPGVADTVRDRLWHPSQRIEALPDGRLRVTFTTAGRRGVLPWVLSWGPAVRVVSPPDLAAQHAEAARGTLGRYAAGV